MRNRLLVQVSIAFVIFALASWAIDAEMRAVHARSLDISFKEIKGELSLNQAVSFLKENNIKYNVDKDEEGQILIIIGNSSYLSLLRPSRVGIAVFDIDGKFHRSYLEILYWNEDLVIPMFNNH